MKSNTSDDRHHGRRGVAQHAIAVLGVAIIAFGIVVLALSVGGVRVFPSRGAKQQAQVAVTDESGSGADASVDSDQVADGEQDSSADDSGNGDVITSDDGSLQLGEDGTPQGPGSSDAVAQMQDQQDAQDQQDGTDISDQGNPADASGDQTDVSDLDVSNYNDGPEQGEASPEGLEPEGKRLSDSLDEYLNNNFGATGVPGMAVAVFGQDSIRYERTLGVCDSSHQTFIIGSLSKSFTAVAIMQLKERGLVDLDAPASRYVPQYGTPDSVTIRSLLNQTSGFGYYDSLGDATVGLSAGHFSYANANYDLLGKVVEAVSGMDYGSYLKQNIFDPLGMTDASAGTSELRADMAPLYRNYFGLNVADGFVHQDSDSAWGSASSGYVRASLSDMEKYLQMYLNLGEGILEPDDVMMMFLSRVPDPGGDTYYGFGWTSFTWDDGELVLSHDGQVENGVTRMCLLPDRHMGIVVMGDVSDYFGGNTNFFQACDDIVSLSVGGDALGVSWWMLFRQHLQMDLLLGVGFFAAIWSAVRLRAWRRKLGRHRLSENCWRLFFLHVVYPTVLVMIPWWDGVKWRDLATFVPDVTISLVVPAAVLYVVGVVKLVQLVRDAKAGQAGATGKAHEDES
ncbi:MAG: serine hydrolase [Atopobiaceae bacterium]